jgi:rhamnogalacturonan endolyase
MLAPVADGYAVDGLVQDAGARDVNAVSADSRQMEFLDRGLVAVRNSSSQVYVGWRMLGTDPANIAFNLYRSADGGVPVKLNASALVQTTDFVDSTTNAAVSNEYFVRPVIAGIELAPSEPFTLAAGAAAQQFLSVPLQVPAGGVTPTGASYTYNANDASVGDLDGDGQYEYIVKWDPSNSKDNSQSGYTGNVYIDAYKLDGTKLWRIDLGRNIRAGAHYTQFMVYDLDGDGKAEVAMKTAPGTIDGQGHAVLLARDSAAADFRTSSGYVLSGPEYLTVFDGETGAELATAPFAVARGSVDSWGDDYGNRVDRFLAGIAYLDGQRPSLIMGRGYYERSTVSAWNWRDGQLTREWVFDTEDATPDPTYEEMGAHSLSIGDVDGDGKDEVIYGAATIDDDGTGLYTSGFGHGDALHVSDMDPSRPGLEVFQVHENSSLHDGNGGTFRSAATGELLVGVPGGADVGRGVAFDIDPRPGYEFWTSANGSIYNVDGTIVAAKPGNMHVNFGVWWDADPYRETLDGTTISDWNFNTDGRVNFDLNPGSSATTPPNVSANNGTKNNPALVADLFGDWREEVIWRRSDNTALHIYTTTIPSTMRLFTLMHDSQYREAIAWQNVAYNQPPHPSFFLGNGMTPPPQPDIYIAANPAPPGDFNGDQTVDGADLPVWRQTFGQMSPQGIWPGDADGDSDADGGDFLLWQRNLAAPNAISVSDALATARESKAIVDEAYAALAGEGLPGAKQAFSDSSSVLHRQATGSVVTRSIAARPTIGDHPCNFDARARVVVRESRNGADVSSSHLAPRDEIPLAEREGFSAKRTHDLWATHFEFCREVDF